MKKPITDRQREMMGMPSISSQMPVEFTKGSHWDEFEGFCSECGKKIRDEWMRGRVSRPIASVAVIEAVGVCAPCSLLTEFHYRLHDDMRITGRRNGRWVTWRRSPSSWIDRVVGFLFGKKAA